MTARMRAAGWKIWRIDAPMTRTRCEDPDASPMVASNPARRLRLRSGMAGDQGLPKRLYGRNCGAPSFGAVALPADRRSTAIVCEGAAHPSRDPDSLYGLQFLRIGAAAEPRPPTVDQRRSASPRENPRSTRRCSLFPAAAAREPFPSIKLMAEAKAPQTLEMRLAYLTSQYPATSHTFISREVAALRKLGVSSTHSVSGRRLATELQDEGIAAEAAGHVSRCLKQPATSNSSARIWRRSSAVPPDISGLSGLP